MAKEDGLHAFQLTYSLGSDLLEVPNCVYVEPALISESPFWGVFLKSWLVGIMENRERENMFFMPVRNLL